MSDTVLRIKLENGEGKAIGTPIEMRIAEGLSLRTAKLVVKELSVKRVLAALDAALPTLGFK